LMVIDYYDVSLSLSIAISESLAKG
jgi:hypothetical protein